MRPSAITILFELSFPMPLFAIPAPPQQCQTPALEPQISFFTLPFTFPSPPGLENPLAAYKQRLSPPFPKPAPSFSNIPLILLLFCAHEVKIFFFPSLSPPSFSRAFLPRKRAGRHPLPGARPSQLLAWWRRSWSWRGGCPQQPLLLPHNFFQACEEFHSSPADTVAHFWGPLAHGEQPTHSGFAQVSGAGRLQLSVCPAVSLSCLSAQVLGFCRLSRHSVVFFPLFLCSGCS